ncbi:hypothetical protein [Streptomyces sp. NPDC055099]
MPNSVVPHWEAARARSGQLRGLDGAQRDVLALIYALIAADDGTAIDAISHWAVRYRLLDTQQLHQDLSALLPGPLDQGATTIEGGIAELYRSRLDELVDDSGHYTGTPGLEELLKSGLDAVVSERHGFPGRAPLEGRIWRRWAALQAPHGIPFDDTLTSDELAAYDASGGDRAHVASGKTVFEHSVQDLTQTLDRLLLPASGAPLLGTKVLVTGTGHRGRSGRLSSVTWTVHDSQHLCAEPPASFKVSFDDRRDAADLAPEDLEPQPEWDQFFAVVYAGQPMPLSWSASVLLAGAEPGGTWQQDAIAALKDGWKSATGRLVVLIPHQPDGTPASDEKSAWLNDAYEWADEIVLNSTSSTGVPSSLKSGGAVDVEDACARLILQTITPDEPTRTWAAQNAVPLVRTPTEAAAAVLKRLDRGMNRGGGQRQVPLPVARNTGFLYWRDALRDADRTLDAAATQWAPRDPDDEHAQWWALNAHIRHPDQHVTDELVVGRTNTLSLIICRRRQVWSDSEVVLLRSPNSHDAQPKTTAPTLFPLQLPTADWDIAFFRDEGKRTQALQKLTSDLGLTIHEDQLRGMGSRPESNLLATQRSAVYLDLSEEELDGLKTRQGAPGDTALLKAIEIHRVADLLSTRVPVLCDWATLGVITRAVVPTQPPASGDITDLRL